MNTIFTWINAGGIISYMLILFSIFSFAIIINRLLLYKSKSKLSFDEFYSKIEELYISNNINSIFSFCETLKSSNFSNISMVIFKNIDKPVPVIEKLAEKELIKNIKELEKYTMILGTIANISVYIGLLGTILGIMQAFTNISTSGAGGIEVVIGGVSKALITTAFGLIVAIPAVSFYNYFIQKIEDSTIEMELLIENILLFTGKEK